MKSRRKSWRFIIINYVLLGGTKTITLNIHRTANRIKSEFNGSFLPSNHRKSKDKMSTPVLGEERLTFFFFLVVVVDHKHQDDGSLCSWRQHRLLVLFIFDLSPRIRSKRQHK